MTENSILRHAQANRTQRAALFPSARLCVLLGARLRARPRARLLGIAVHVELRKKEEQGQDVPGVHNHDAWRVAGAPVWRPKRGEGAVRTGIKHAANNGTPYKSNARYQLEREENKMRKSH